MTIRVRFAPSPTGFLHLGGLRTALYNYLFAKQNNGKFLLRIEDTDRKRLVPEAARILENTLNHLGLMPDESPGNGGGYGPYFQSERLSLYRSSLDELLKAGDAYPCFCSESRLDLIRKDALRRRQVPKYDNRCRNLTRKQVDEKIRQGLPHCYRFTLRTGNTEFTDIVYGKYAYEPAENEGDPVIVKEDGYPTYHFANVVDDHYMDVSHVLRGEEWLISTPKHLLMYKAFGWHPPQFAHLPLILNKDGTKLSKRQDDLRVESLTDKGYYPLAILNFITKIGGGFDEKIQNLVPMEDLIKKFNLSQVNAHSCRLDMNKLDDLNSQEIQRRLGNAKEETALAEDLKMKVKTTLGVRFPTEELEERVLSDSYLTRVLHWASSASRLVKLDELVSHNFEYLWLPPKEANIRFVECQISMNQFEKVIDIVKSLPIDFSRSDVSTHLRSFAKAENLKFATLMKILRSCLSNLKEGPSVGEMIEVLGKSETASRLEKTLNRTDRDAK